MFGCGCVVLGSGLGMVMVVVMVVMGRGGGFRGGEGGGEGDGSGEWELYGLEIVGWDLGGEREESSGVIIAPALLVSGFNTEREI